MFLMIAAAIGIAIAWLFFRDVAGSSPPAPPELTQSAEEPSDRQRLLTGLAVGAGHFVLYLTVFALTFGRAMGGTTDTFESMLPFLLGLPLMPLAFVFPLPLLLMLLNSAVWGLAGARWGPALWRRMRGRRGAS